MGNIIVSEFITLDGVIEGPEWSIPFFNEEIGKFKKDDLVASDALLMGRVTYEIHAQGERDGRVKKRRIPCKQ